MVNRKLLWLLCLVWSVPSFGQTVSPEALVPAGKTDLIGQYSLSWTLGQVADATLIDSDRMLTEGFQQPQLLIESLPIPASGVKPMAVVDFACTVFPNPSSDRVNVHIQQTKSQMGVISLLSSDGQVLRSERIDLEEYRAEWEVSRLTPGTYLIRVSTLEGALLRSFRLSKI